jgi:hypothetical protein
MNVSRKFIVAIPGWKAESSDKDCADIVREGLDLLFERQPKLAEPVEVVALPDLGADDSDLQVGFRILSWLALNGTYLSNATITTAQAKALVAELSKEKPGRTASVDEAALSAVRQIRQEDARPGRQQVQRDARAQLIITDAICGCLLERSS